MDVGMKAAKSDLSKLVAKAQAGERVFLTNHGNRVVELIPVKLKADRLRGYGMFAHKLKLPRGWGSQKQREADEKELLSQIEDLA